jgi:hypothetical protein
MSAFEDRNHVNGRVTAPSGEQEAVSGNVSGGAINSYIEQRSEDRFAVALPAIAVVCGKDYSIRVFNVALGGAMFETSAPLASGSRLTFRCGTITVSAAVAWQTSGYTGVRFDSPVNHRDVTDQLSRSLAIAARRQQKLGPLTHRVAGPGANQSLCGASAEAAVNTS